MNLQELFDHKQDVEHRKQKLQDEERKLDRDTKNHCIESLPEALKVDWNMIRRMIRNS